MSLATKLRRVRKPPPEGWDLIEPTLEQFEVKMREAETEPHEGKRKTEINWPIFRIHHQRSRYIYDMYYKKAEISRELYEFCLTAKFADAALIAKWKKQGYENLCCVKCVQTRDSNFGTACICRVPKSKLDADRVIECVHCGCHGCSG
uniref:Protein BUD31 homolog n=1 Tax=Caenorhabditis tropicalis TaxID=1561998 RepID=A0A1I7UHE4_9PELO